MDLHFGITVARTYPVVFFALKASNFDVSKTTFGLRINAHVMREMYRGFSCSTTHTHVVALIWRTTQIQVHISRTHLNFHSSQRKGTDIEMGFTATEPHGDVCRDIIIEPYVPFVRPVPTGLVAWLLDVQIGDARCRIVAYLRLPRCDVVIKVCRHQILGPAADPKVTPAHPKIHVGRTGFVSRDGASLVLHWAALH